MQILTQDTNSVFIPSDFLHVFPSQTSSFPHALFSDLKKNPVFLNATLGLPVFPVAFSHDKPMDHCFKVDNVHGNNVVLAHEVAQKADAHIIAGTHAEIKSLSQKFLAIQTADCLPIVFYYCDTQVFIGGLTHAGWRGLTAGIIGNTIEKLKAQAQKLNINEQHFLAHLKVFVAPAIFGVSYECGASVKDALQSYKEALFKNETALSSLTQSSHVLSQVFDVCANVQADCDLQSEITACASENKHTLSADSVFPDIQLLGVLECVVKGIEPTQISIMRTNTYHHAVLPSFRYLSHTGATHLKTRLWTHLMLECPNTIA